MQALTELYRQPHQLALQRIAGLMDVPNIRSGDTRAFRLFADTGFSGFFKIRALVEMLDQLGVTGRTELIFQSHVSRLLVKLPHDLRANFKRHVNPLKTPISNLLDLVEWQEYKLRVQEDGTQFSTDFGRERTRSRREQQRAPKFPHKPTGIFHGSKQRQDLKPKSGQVQLPSCDHKRNQRNTAPFVTVTSRPQTHQRRPGNQ